MSKHTSLNFCRPVSLFWMFAGVICGGLMLRLMLKSGVDSEQNEGIPRVFEVNTQQAPAVRPAPEPAAMTKVTDPSAPVPPPVENLLPDDTFFSADMKTLVEGVEQGIPVRVRIGPSERRYLFRPMRVTADEFRISAGPVMEMPSSFRVFEGRRMQAGGRLTEPAKLAVVNDTVSMALETAEGNVLIERDEKGNMVARLLRSGDPELGIGRTHCFEQGGIAGMQAVNDRPPIELAADISLASQSGEGAEAAWPDHNYYRNSPQYDASLKDILILMVSGTTQTGSSSNLSSRAASYLTYAAKTADTYENQLGMRYLLQELVLIASDSGQDDIEFSGTNNKDTGSDDLNALEDWCDIHRPKSTYGWGHAAGWTQVNGDNGSTIGWAWIRGYGSSGSAFSVQERNYDWDVHAHEVGHNVGANHTSGGLMNSSISNNTQDFFRENNTDGGGFTAAMEIYEYMSSSSRNDIYGAAPLRHAEELPFAVDDNVSTDQNTPVTFNPVENDLDSVMFGAANGHLRLVEAGAVYPANAGTVTQDGNELTFTPVGGFTGNVWFRYTISGNVGNGGKGWLHAADVVVTVGGNNSDPGLTPTLTLVNDEVVSDLSAPVRVNPLLNDEGEGRLWSGDVEALNLINGTPQSYSDDAFHLVSATLVTGNGTVTLDTRDMTRSASEDNDYTGYVEYTPGASEPSVIEISYTVEDANGLQASASIFIHNRAPVTLTASTVVLSEEEGRVVDLTFSRSGAADLSASETVTFAIGGEVQVGGANADIALGGHAAFDVESRTGTLVIPAGHSAAVLNLSAYEDGVAEGSETVLVQVVSLETLALPPEPVLTLTVSDAATGRITLFFENFDTFPEPGGIGNGNNWNNPSAGDDRDWEVQSGNTPSNQTGPDTDYTTGTGRYVYLETTNGSSGATAFLESPVIDLTGESEAFMQVAYHMYGAAMGELAFDLQVNGGGWITNALPVLSGQQSADGTDWKLVQLDLSSHLPATVQFRFRATKGSSFTSDIALDNFEVFKPLNLTAETPVIVAQPLSQQVEEEDPVYFSVVARSYPAAGYQWYKDGTPIPGATRSVYTLESVAAADAGTYTCEVTSGVTVVSQDAILSIDTVPTVVIDSPAETPVELTSGLTLWLEATATDDGPLTTTWTTESGPVSAVFADDSAEDTSVTFPQSGAYRLRLTADDGSRQGFAELLVIVGSGAVEDRFPTGNVVGTYPLNASSGTTAADSSGTTYDGTLVGGPVWQSSGGKIGGALQFDGANDLVELGSLPGFNTEYSTSERSVALWFRADDISITSRKQVLWEAGGGTHGYSIYLYNGLLYVATWSDTGTTNDAYLTTSAISNNTWHHVALTLSSSSLVGYLDGSPFSDSGVSPLPEHSNDNGIGNAHGSSRFHDAATSSGQDHGFDGLIDHVGVYTRVLSPTEVSELAGRVQNRAPIVNAGMDNDPGNPSSGIAFSLSGSGSDPDTDPVTFTWEKESGPGNVTFADASAPTTTATFAASGSYVLRLSATDGSATVSDTVAFSVTNSSSPGMIQLTASSYSPGEGDGNLSVLLERVNGLSGVVGVTFSTSDGTALDGSDYTAVSQSVTWSDTESGSKTVLIPILDDGDLDPSEQFTVQISSPTGGASLGAITSATVIISDNDLPGTLAFSSAAYSANENDGTVTLTVTRTGGSTGAASVSFATADDSASAGADYTADSGTLNWVDGESASKTLEISLTDDSSPETSESFTLTLSNAVGATLGSPSVATVTITDNDFSPSQIAGLVGWYNAQELTGANGTAVTTWSDTTGGSNTVGNPLTQLTGDRYLAGTQTEVAPTLQTVSLNGHSYRSVRFVPGTNGNGEYELLKAADLVVAGDTTRTVIAVYKGGLSTESRVIGFGSSQEEDINGDALVWNFGCDGNGTSRFDGAMIGGYSAGLDRSQVVIRTAVMESKISFDEYIDVLDAGFVDQQVLSNGNPSNALADTRGHFYIGDLQEQSNSDGSMASEFDVLEVLVFDAVLSDTDRQNVQNWLKEKYTTELDADEDGLPDTWESLNSVDDPDADSDGDGMKDGEEYVSGTDPNNINDVFQVSRAEAVGGIRLQTPLISGKYYRVSWRASMTTGDWSVVSGQEGVTPSTGTPLDLLVTEQGFYRVEVSNTAWSGP